MGTVDFEGILTKKHHYWRNMIILLVVAAVIGSFFLTDQLTPTNQKELMMEFAQESVKEEYQPEFLEPEQIVNALGETIYTASWKYGSLPFYANLKYLDNREDPDLVIIIHFPRIENLESERTLAIVNSFFKTEAEDLDCLEGSIGKACEKVWFEEESKKSIGIYNIFGAENSVIYISKMAPSSKSIVAYM